MGRTVRLMSRRRSLSTEISLDAKVNRLAREHGDFAALLYTWMIPHAEEDATLKGSPEELLALVCPLRRDKEPEDLDEALWAMDESGLVCWDGERVWFPPDTFYKYQTQIEQARRRSDQPKRSGRGVSCGSVAIPPENPFSSSSSVSSSVSVSKIKPVGDARAKTLAAPPPDQPRSDPPKGEAQAEVELRGTWPELDDVRQYLDGLNGLVPASFPVGQLYDPAFWLRIEAETDQTEVFYLDEIPKYLGWWAEQPPSKRHRNVRRGFGSWIRIELAREAGRVRRAKEQKQQVRR